MLCISGQTDCCQATNSQNSVWTRPSQTRTRPDPQLSALCCAVLCCAIPGQEWLEWLGVHFYLVESSVMPKDCAKKTNWADKQMQQPFVLIGFVYAHERACVCVCVCVHGCVGTSGMRVWLMVNTRQIVHVVTCWYDGGSSSWPALICLFKKLHSHSSYFNQINNHLKGSIYTQKLQSLTLLTL